MSLLRDIEPIKTKEFLHEKFKDYYKDAKIELPPRFTSREWGFLNWKGGIMNRHIRFNSIKEVTKYLGKVAPAHCYHSVAYYKDPGRNSMIEKEWQGADLIFDLDADHLPEMEDVKKGKISFSKLMEYIREQTYRLVVDVLLGDFGLDESDLLITFSGGRGYHVHVRTPGVLSLPSGARRELSDYMTGKGLNLKNVLDDAGYTKEFPVRGKGIERKNLGIQKLPNLNSKGWNGIITRQIHRMMNEARNEDKKIEEESVKKMGFPKGSLQLNKSNEEAFNQLSKKLQNKFVRIALKLTAIYPDEPVTGDIHRLIRLPGSLHGGSGLRVTIMNKEKLEKFDPMSDAIAFSQDEVKVRSVATHPVTMGNNYAKLQPNEVTCLPEAAAVYFMARKFATICLET